MKRHPTLAHLSRDHHEALILAQLLKKNAAVYRGMPTTPDTKWKYALDFYQRELRPHFQQEEEMMQLLAGLDSSLDIKIEEIKSEHVLLREMFMSTPSQEGLVDHLDHLGISLDNHIRNEERELFPMIEKVCDEEKMRILEVLLTRG
jgi:iron-sulfur cluster repair protein YtfE (RIC family)